MTRTTENRAAALAVAAVTLVGLAILLRGLPGASAFDAGTVALSLGFCLQLVVVAAWAHQLYGPRPAIAAAGILVTLILAVRESGLVITDMLSTTALLIFLFSAVHCLLDPRIESVLFGAVTFALAACILPAAHLLVLLAGRWLATTPHEHFGRVAMGTLVSATIIAATGLASATAIKECLPFVSNALLPCGDAPTVEASALPSIILLTVARPWRRHRLGSDCALVAALVMVLVSVVPCSGAAPWRTCVESAAPARALLLAALPIAALLASANWSHERPTWWHWVAFGLLAVALFQSLVV